MDLRSDKTIERVETEIDANKELAANKRAEARSKRDEMQKIQEQEEEMDIRAEEARRHSEGIQQSREDALMRIEECHEYIDGYTEDIQMYESEENENRERVIRQNGMIQYRRDEAKSRRSKAREIKADADDACLRGSSDRQTHGDHKSSRHLELMRKAESKQREALQLEEEADDLEKQAVVTEKNIIRLREKIRHCVEQRRMVEAEKKTEEGRVAGISSHGAPSATEVSCWPTKASNL